MLPVVMRRDGRFPTSENTFVMVNHGKSSSELENIVQSGVQGGFDLFEQNGMYGRFPCGVRFLVDGGLVRALTEALVRSEGYYTSQVHLPLRRALLAPDLMLAFVRLCRLRPSTQP